MTYFRQPNEDSWSRGILWNHRLFGREWVKWPLTACCLGCRCLQLRMYIRYLLVCNKLPSLFSAYSSKYLYFSFCGSVSEHWLLWELWLKVSNETVVIVSAGDCSVIWGLTGAGEGVLLPRSVSWLTSFGPSPQRPLHSGNTICHLLSSRVKDPGEGKRENLRQKT